MSVIKKIAFEKGDERSIQIGYFAGRIAWIFTTTVLLIWSIQETLSTGGLPVQFVVFSASQVVFWIAYLYYRGKLGG